MHVVVDLAEAGDRQAAALVRPLRCDVRVCLSVPHSELSQWTVLRQACVRSERRFQRTSFACGRYCSCFCASVPFSRMPPPKQGKAKVTTKKKSRPGGPRPRAGRPPIQPGRSAVKIRLDSEVISAVDTVAKLRKLDRSRVIEGALRQWLKEDKTAPGV